MIPSASALLTTLLPLLTAPQDTEKVEFQWKLEAGKTLVTTLEIETNTESDMEFRIDGNEAIPGHESSHSFSSSYVIQHRDQLKKVAGGLPVAVRREFVELDFEHEAEASGDTLDSPVTGHEIEIDESGDEVELELPEDLELTDRQRDSLRIHGKLGAFLPERAVEIGEEWDFDAAVLAQLFGYGRGLIDYPEPDMPADMPEGAMVIKIGAGKTNHHESKVEPWNGTCTLQDVSEEDGHRIATITLEAELEIEAETQESTGEEEGGGIQLVLGAGGEDRSESLEGSVRFDLTAGRLLSVSLETESASATESENETEMGTILFNSSSSETKTLELTIEEKKDQ